MDKIKCEDCAYFQERNSSYNLCGGVKPATIKHECKAFKLKKGYKA